MTPVPPDCCAEPEASDLRELQGFLRANRNRDGGWGYYPGKASRLEPTCWALLALRGEDARVLQRWPAVNGFLPERPSGSVNFAFHALALLTLGARGVEHETGNARLARSLEAVRGVALGRSTINRQDSNLQGWSWIDGTFSWVEPTAWAILALKKHRARGGTVDSARIKEAEALLIDRCCATGGWNYGNSNMLGKELRAYVPTTAVALLAMQDRTEAEIPRSADYLEREGTGEASSVALSLALLALSALRRPSSAVTRTLQAQLGTTLRLQSHAGVAMALAALQAGGKDEAFIL